MTTQHNHDCDCPNHAEASAIAIAAGAVRAVLIDPELGTLQEGLIIPGDIEVIYELLGCDLIDAVRLEDGHAAYVDDEGFDGDPEFFTVIDGTPYAGRALFVGPVDEQGNTTACTLPLDWFNEHVKGARRRAPVNELATVKRYDAEG